MADLALKPRRVLEIGCSVGLLVRHLAPACEAYRAPTCRPRQSPGCGWIRTQAGLRHVEVTQGAATELENIAPGSIDTVILNSVVQYFPDVDYLVDVLTKAIALVAPGGRVFVGDIRHLGLLSVFHGSVQLAQAAAGLELGQLRSRIARALAGEKELLIDPAFFAALAERLPGIGGVEVLLGAAARQRADALSRGAACWSATCGAVEKELGLARLRCRSGCRT